ncbi:MAG: divergent polysaccharide deacetylase family protein [Rhodospirillaceae bacterium]|jgi:polysaccharide deacetylase 2 family uncharacterized protein YibQ|nr:divergent polysaccharide deacetylase family protein [Rhodospirillaceae bacterium]MBT5040204.1 divergent polysaccharide deacetylase family protein [Rhodospirillaceae bacterium]MBT6828081.1 divergent polysaccharide deacetylase family protein [Rhodospirillaceae bacterium]
MKSYLAAFAAGFRRIRLSKLTARQAQIPLTAIVIVLLAAGAFAWQGSRENVSEASNTVEKLAKLKPAAKPTSIPDTADTPDFVAQAINKSAQSNRVQSPSVDSETALAILVGTKGEMEFDFLPALAGPDEKLSARYESRLARLAGGTESDQVVLIKPIINEPATAPKLKSPPVAIEEPDLPDWRRFAALSKETGTAPIIAIVIDDLGHSEREFAHAMSLGEGITLAFLPYTDRVAEFARRARQKGFEILVHMPMEPTDASADPGPNALLTSLSEEELKRRLAHNLSRLEGYVGINNHMGSKFSQDRGAMKLVLDELAARGLLYLDSVTIGSTVGEPVATASRMPFASRDVFLDSVAEKGFIERQLRVVENVARQSGRAVAIGHPYAATMEVLKRWLPDARARGFEFVPISTVAALECAC